MRNFGLNWWVVFVAAALAAASACGSDGDDGGPTGELEGGESSDNEPVVGGENDGDEPEASDPKEPEAEMGEEPGAAGAAAEDPGEAPGATEMEGEMPGEAEPDLRVTASRRGMCDISTDYPGDEACLAAPAEDEGFQLHIGPADYGDQADVERFLMQPGGESSQCFFIKLPIEQDVNYFVWELSGRPGTHHIINTLVSGDHPDGWGTCAGDERVGSIGGASRAHMPPAPVAPENEGLAIPLAAHQQLQSDMHYFNLTDEPIMREYWMNLYYVPEAEVTQAPSRIAGLGGFGWNFAPIQPGTHQVYQYECGIESDGRIIQLLGHTHKHGVRETAHIRRANGDRVKVFEQFDYLEPAIFNFDTLTENPAFSDSSPGAFTGMLEVSAGDTLEWECEVNNTSDVALRYTNFVETGEMCNIWGMTVGPAISCFLQ